MAQRGKAGKSLVQVGRDYIHSFLHINISNQEPGLFPLGRTCQWIYDFFYKQQKIEKLQAQLERTKAKVRRLEDRLAEKKAEIKDAWEKLRRLTNKRLAEDKDNEDLLEIAQLLARFSEEMHEGEAYEHARLWMQPRLDNLVEEAANFVIQNSPKDVPEASAEGFREDLFAYKDWLEESMEYARPLRTDLKKLNRKRCIRHPHPYRKAIEKIKFELPTEELTQEECNAVEQMFRFLSEHL